MIEREMDNFNKRTAYKAAEMNRLNSHWDAKMQDINVYLKSELPRLQARSRWLFRNNPHAGEYMNAMKNYIIGVGFSLQSQVRTITVDEQGDVEETYKEAFNKFVEDLFNEWAEDVDINASVSAPEDFRDTQGLCFTKILEDGEIFIHPVVDLDADGPVPLRLEIIEPDSLNTFITEYNGNPVTMGVEFNANTWQPVAYWIYSGRKQTNHYVTQNKAIRVPASEIIHIFPKLRPRQARGVPPLSIVTQRFFDLDEYTDAELMGNKIAACMGVFISQPPGQSDPDMLEPSSGQLTTDSKGNPIDNLEPAMIAHVPPGSDVKVISPQKPGTTFDMFTQYHQRAMGAGAQWGVSYLTMTRDVRKVSHAGGRLAYG